MSKPLRIIERKLGRERALGQCDGDLVEIDPRQCSRERLDTVLHETMHFALPEAREPDVRRAANLLATALWRDRWRRIEL
jgi:hypothetical protein